VADDPKYLKNFDELQEKLVEEMFSNVRPTKEGCVLHLDYEDGSKENFECQSPAGAVVTLEMVKLSIEHRNKPKIRFWEIKPAKIPG
jgi:hypothetical protein